LELEWALEDSISLRTSYMPFRIVRLVI
jgi:hypothetical protein